MELLINALFHADILEVKTINDIIKVVYCTKKETCFFREWQFANKTLFRISQSILKLLQFIESGHKTKGHISIKNQAKTRLALK